jgi:flagellar basal-body rod modification protein FlgD
LWPCLFFGSPPRASKKPGAGLGKSNANFSAQRPAKVCLISAPRPLYSRTEFKTEPKAFAFAPRRSRRARMEHAMSGSSAASSIVPPVTSTPVNAAVAATGITSADFLTLLVGELQNQDPLQPTDTSTFVTQLSQYATFDQSQTLNTQLGTLLTSFNSLLTMNSVNYIGHSVEVKGNTTTLQAGVGLYGYSLTAPAASVQLSIQDSNGNIVWTHSGSTSTGLNEITWPGQTNDGTQLPDGGQYTLNVTATDSSGNSVLGYTTIVAPVTGVDDSSGTTQLELNGVFVDVSDVVGVRS